jgi:maltose alpha-D-glucosyltransferase / alpha-amylase
MLRSFHYAAYAGLYKATAERPADVVKMEPAAKFWYRWSALAFLKDYRENVRGQGLVPETDAAFEAALRPFLIEKALYETLYELNNRPAWITIPIEGLLGLLPSPTALGR